MTKPSKKKPLLLGKTIYLPPQPKYSPEVIEAFKKLREYGERLAPFAKKMALVLPEGLNFIQPILETPVVMVNPNVVSICGYEREIPNYRYAKRVVAALVAANGQWIELGPLVKRGENLEGPRRVIKRLKSALFLDALETRPGRNGGARLNLDRLRVLYT
ncbi:MAG: hypothetical protein HQ519_10635 [Planctomycetes bacterium]|nr:hypothetical protein [Planctomycetota bacterium]